MSGSDMVNGVKVLVGDYNWRDGPFWPALMAWMFGKRERFEHLGMKVTIAWHKNKPYLTSIREVSN